jgi:hypothetical protein
VTAIDWQQARPVEELIALLQQHHPDVAVTLGLSNGATLVGYVHAVDTRSPGYVVMRDQAPGAAQGSQTHLSLSNVVTLTILHPAALQHRTVEWAPIGGLELRRLLTASATALGVSISGPPSPNDAERAAIGAFLGHLSGIVESIRGDETGRQAWEQITTLQLVIGELPDVVVHDERAHCALPSNQNDDPGLTGWLLRFERAL